MNIREIIVPALLLLAASLSQVAAQPAGVYLLETTHFYSDCNVNATIAISLTRFGPEVSCQPFTTSFTYRSCNTTHQLEYICEDSSCSQNCTLLSSTPLNTAIGPDFFRGATEINYCFANEGYQLARCQNFDAPGWLPTALASISTTQQGFWLSAEYSEPNPPTCDTTGNGVRIIGSAFNGGIPVSGCIPSYDFSSSSYSTCNETGYYAYTCSDELCSQNCVLTFSDTPVACPATNQSSIYKKFCYTIPPAPVEAPVAAPVAVPIAAPVAVPIAAPVAVPIAAPIDAPVAAPVAAPVVAPIAAPAAVTAPVGGVSNPPTASTPPVAASPVLAPRASSPIAPKSPVSSSASTGPLTFLSLGSFLLCLLIANIL